jgi:antitoxin Phd
MVKQMEVDPRKPARRWKLQTARARLSEVYRRARTEGPQLITSDDNEGVIVLSAERYGWLVSRAHKPRSLVQFFRDSPLVGMDLDIDRGPDAPRDLDL